MYVLAPHAVTEAATRGRQILEAAPTARGEFQRATGTGSSIARPSAAFEYKTQVL